MQYSTIVFDWDGTLMDSTWSIGYAIQLACKDMGFMVPTHEKAKWVIGLALDEALAKVVPELTQEQVPDFINAYRKNYFSLEPDLKLFDGVHDLLQQLKEQNLQLAVATGKSRVGLNKALEKHDLQGFFDVTKTADQTAGKPNPLMLEEIMEELLIDAAQMIMIGDTSHDILMAQNASCDSIAVTYGAHNIQELNKVNPSFMADSVDELQRLLSLYSKGK